MGFSYRLVGHCGLYIWNALVDCPIGRHGGRRPVDKKVFGRYHDIVLLFLGFVLTTVVGGVLTYYFQERSWTHQHGVELLEAERAEATDVFDELSVQMDRRLYRMRRLIFGLRQGRDSVTMERRWDSYREVLILWNDHLNRNIALTERYFGIGARNLLQHEIQTEFRRLGELLESASPGHFTEEEVDNLSTLADHINDLVYRLDAKMLQQLQDGNIGIYRNRGR